MLKVLYLPIETQLGVEDAFKQAGAQLFVYPFWNDYLSHNSKQLICNHFLEKIQEFKPDLIHMQLQITGLLDNVTLYRAREIVPNVIITNWSGDIRSDPARDFRHFISVSKSCDYSFLSNTGQIKLFDQLGGENIRYWQVGNNPKRNFPMNLDSFKYDISFSGYCYPTVNKFPDSNLRLQVASELRRHYGPKFGLFGGGYPNGWRIDRVEFSKMNEIYNSSICTLCINHFNNVSHYFSDRLLMCMASGRPCLAWNFPEAESYFCHGHDIILVHNVAEIIHYVDLLKQDPELAKTIGQNAWLKIKAEHCFISRIMELLEITGLIGKL